MIQYHSAYGRVEVLALGDTTAIVKLLVHRRLPRGESILVVGVCELQDEPYPHQIRK